MGLALVVRLTSNVDPEVLGRIVEAVATRGHVFLPEAALILNLHIQTVRSLVKKGQLRSIWVGRGFAVPVEELERFKTYGNYKPSEEELYQLRATIEANRREGVEKSTPSDLCEHCGQPLY